MSPGPPSIPLFEEISPFTKTSQTAVDTDSVESPIFIDSFRDNTPKQNVFSSDKFMQDEPESYTGSEEIARIFFKEGRPITYFEGRLIIINESNKFSIPDPQSSPLESLIQEEEFNQSIVSSSGSKPVNITIFISDNIPKLDYLADNSMRRSNGAPKSNEIIFYIKTDDQLSKNITHIVSGTSVQVNQKPFRSVIRATNSLSDEFVSKLFNSISYGKTNFTDYLLSGLNNFLRVNELGYGLLNSALRTITEWINKLLIDEKYWNPKSNEGNENKSNTVLDTVFKGIDTVINRLQEEIKRVDKFTLPSLLKKGNRIKSIVSKISFFFKYLSRALKDIAWIHNELIKTGKELHQLNLSMAKEWHQHNLSLIMGLWNGIVDMFSGFVFLVRIPFAIGEFTSKGMSAVVNTLKDKKSQVFFEYIDNLINSLKEVDLKKIFKYSNKQLKDLVKDINWSAFPKSAEEVSDKVVEGTKDTLKKVADAIYYLSSYEKAYYAGYIATFFIPVGLVAQVLGKAGTAGKLLGKGMVWVDTLMLEIFGIAISGVKMGVKPLTNLLKALINKFKKGTQAVKNIIDEIFKMLRKLFDDFITSIKISYSNLEVLISRNTKEAREIIEQFIFQLYDFFRRFPNQENIELAYAGAAPSGRSLSFKNGTVELFEKETGKKSNILLSDMIDGVKSVDEVTISAPVREKTHINKPKEKLSPTTTENRAIKESKDYWISRATHERFPIHKGKFREIIKIMKKKLANTKYSHLISDLDEKVIEQPLDFFIEKNLKAEYNKQNKFEVDTLLYGAKNKGDFIGGARPDLKNREPDIIEVFIDRGEIYVTDVTQNLSNAHLFKTYVYVEIIKHLFKKRIRVFGSDIYPDGELGPAIRHIEELFK